MTREEALALEQGTDEWRKARTGSLGSSQIKEALARTKSGWGAGRRNMIAQLVVERLTGEPTESFMSAAMQHGVDTEPQARAAYAFTYGVEVEQVGLVLHPTIKGTHSSPDGLVGSDGALEVKCPQPATHMATLLADEVPSEYQKQIDWHMACSGRQWVDFISFDPRFPVELQMFVKRVHRDQTRIIELETEVTAFLREVDEKVSELQALKVGEAA